MNKMYCSYYSSPLGRILMSSDGEALCGLWFEGQSYFPDITNFVINQNLPIFEQTSDWLDRYFAGKVTSPRELLLKPAGSIFQIRVWQILAEIPFGKVYTYGRIAQIYAEKYDIKRMSAQAVGNAVAHNKISIIIPCHRVIGSDGSLTGYAGGLDRKRQLLELEGFLHDSSAP